MAIRREVEDLATVAVYKLQYPTNVAVRFIRSNIKATEEEAREAVDYVARPRESRVEQPA